MKSIALYYKEKEKKEQNAQKEGEKLAEEFSDVNGEKDQGVAEQFHINIWKVEKGKLFLSPTIYFDFGISVSMKIEKLCLYLPFQIKGPVIDLGKILHNNKPLLSTIFNEEIQVETQQNDCYCKVSFLDDSKKTKFFLYQLGDSNIDVKTYTNHDNKKQNEGTYIYISRDSNPEEIDAVPFYIRFRVQVLLKNEVCRSVSVTNDIFQSAFSKSDLFDIRINERRQTPAKVIETIEKDGFKRCKFSKIHIFYMADVHETIVNQSSLNCDSRILEMNQWHDYEPSSELANTVYIAHHWHRKRKCKLVTEKNTNKLESPINSFNLFFNTVYPSANFIRIFVYMFVAILLGAIGSWLSNFDDGNHIVSGEWRFGILILMFVLTVVYLVCRNFKYIHGTISRKR